MCTPLDPERAELKRFCDLALLCGVAVWCAALLRGVVVWCAALLRGVVVWCAALLRGVVVWCAALLRGVVVWCAALLRGVVVRRCCVVRGVATWRCSHALLCSVVCGLKEVDGNEVADASRVASVLKPNGAASPTATGAASSCGVAGRRCEGQRAHFPPVRNFQLQKVNNFALAERHRLGEVGGFQRGWGSSGGVLGGGPQGVLGSPGRFSIRLHQYHLKIVRKSSCV